MESHKYITLSYELYSDNAEGIHELIEKAPAEHPLQFISGFGTMLEAFEGNIVPLSEGDEFDFNLSVDEAYGPYVQEHVIELDKQVFTIDGRFDKENIYPGNVIPLTNADGNRFDGIIVMRRGEIVEQGSYDELMEKHGYFAALCTAAN